MFFIYFTMYCFNDTIIKTKEKNFPTPSPTRSPVLQLTLGFYNVYFECKDRRAVTTAPLRRRSSFRKTHPRGEDARGVWRASRAGVPACGRLRPLLHPRRHRRHQCRRYRRFHNPRPRFLPLPLYSPESSVMLGGVSNRPINCADVMCTLRWLHAVVCSPTRTVLV